MAAAYVQKAITGATGSGASIALAFGSNVTAGNHIEVVVRITATSRTITVTDTLLHTYTQVATVDQATDGHQLAIFHAYNISGGANTVTATHDGANSLRRGIAIQEVSGLATATDPVDDFATNTGADSSCECGSVTMTADGIIVTGMGNSGGQTTTLDTDYTQLAENSTGRLAMGHRILAAATDEAIHTWSANNNWSAVTANFKEPAAGGGGASPRPSTRMLLGVGR